MSTTYYALFGHLAKTSADLLVGGIAATRSDEAWRQVYRALQHTFAADACRNQNMLKKFPAGIQDFAIQFATMQEKRNLADYDPHQRYLQSDVITDIALSDAAIKKFSRAPISDRRAFAVWVHFKSRPKP